MLIVSCNLYETYVNNIREAQVKVFISLFACPWHILCGEKALC